jgi:ribosome-associated protein
VETMVEGYWHVGTSALVDAPQKTMIAEKLAPKINAEGFLLVKSQEARNQLGNKQLVIKKMNELVTKALVVPKKRKPTKPGKAAKEKRLLSKKQQSERKEGRRKKWPE